MFVNLSTQDKVKMFERDLLETNRGFNYYVDWSNIDGYQPYLIEFHAMDALIGLDNNRMYKTFQDLVRKLPTVVATFPYLFALAKADRKEVWRGGTNLKIIGSEIDSEDFQEYSFAEMIIRNGLGDDQIERYYDFFKQMGLKALFQNLLEKSVLDYVIGVLVGLDSNGRKNRGGAAFELACKPIITEICQRFNITVIEQKKFSVLRKWGFDISPIIEKRKADFILFDASNKKCMNIEVNFYNGSGSKPEEIIDSYINRQANLAENGIDFALITDGNCWDGITSQIMIGFQHLKYIMNFKLAKGGILEEVIRVVFDRRG
ncbi:MAG: DpnII family type II restriction endonuclease [bacterium]|jgi:type II restriction enzyme